MLHSIQDEFIKNIQSSIGVFLLLPTKWYQFLIDVEERASGW